MCEWNDTVEVNVRISSELSHTGKDIWKLAKIDKCIAPIVKALQEGGIDMLGSCCGHGKVNGEIQLSDGRTILILGKRDYKNV